MSSSSNKNKKKRKLNKPKLMIFILVALAVLVFLAVAAIEITNVSKKNAELEARKERLEEMIEAEKARQGELEDEAAYVQTQKYIEEKAKSIGYIYPDEIIYKPEDD